MQRNHYDTVSQFVTDEPEFCWIDWGNSFAAVVPDAPFWLVIFSQRIHAFTSFGDAIEFVANRVKEDRQ